MIEFGDRQTNDDGVERSPAWLVSMADVTALMLTFFVMLFSMSHLKSERWNEIISLINTSLQPKEIEEPLPASALNISTIDALSGLSTEYLNRILIEKLERDPILNQARLTALQEQVVVSVPSDLLFEPAGATLVPGAGEAIELRLEAAPQLELRLPLGRVRGITLWLRNRDLTTPGELAGYLQGLACFREVRTYEPLDPVAVAAVTNIGRK